MKKLQTEFKIRSSEKSMSLSQNVLTIGSCFSQVMGEQLNQYKFDCLINPTGTVFNPVSISNMLISKGGIDETRVVEREGMFCHYDYHSDLRSETQPGLIDLIQSRNVSIQSFIKKADWMIITLGTAFVYELKSDQSIVSNCHKVPQNLFNKRLLSLEEMLSSYEVLFDTISDVNPNLKTILTVSPVRHIKDGIPENQMSKSLLRVLCGLLEKKDYVFYFPSYEIMIDELRDYRYYKDDMLHPTQLAEEIIWERFTEAFFDSDTQYFQKEWKTILSAINHRPFNPKSDIHQAFVKAQLSRLDKLKSKIDVSEEREVLLSQLI